MLTTRDPFRDIDHLLQRVGTRPTNGRPSLPMDAYRRGGEVWIHFDLPGVEPDDIEVDVDKKVLTVAASRGWDTVEGDQMLVNERPTGDYERRIQLSEGLDADGVEASFEGGVLTLRIPEIEKPEPRRITVSTAKDPIEVDADER
jgi:HSP20 family protein